MIISIKSSGDSLCPSSWQSLSISITIFVTGGKVSVSALCFEPGLAMIPSAMTFSCPLHRKLTPASPCPDHFDISVYPQSPLVHHVSFYFLLVSNNDLIASLTRLPCICIAPSRLRTAVPRGATIACSPSRLISPRVVLCFCSSFLFQTLYLISLDFFYFIPSWTVCRNALVYTLQQCSFVSSFFCLFLLVVSFCYWSFDVDVL